MGATFNSNPDKSVNQYMSNNNTPEKDVPKHFFQAQTLAQTFALTGNYLDKISCVFKCDIYLRKA
jgi:hypothetical protein